MRLESAPHKLLRLWRSGRKRWRKSAKRWGTRPNLTRDGKRFLENLYQASAEAGIRPFLMWGTLLGCVREGRLLRHDTDIDVGILARDYGNKDKLIAAMRKRGYELAFDRPYKLRFTHPRSKVWLDVDVVYSWNDRMITSFEPNEKKSSRRIFRSMRSTIFERWSPWAT